MVKNGFIVSNLIIYHWIEICLIQTILRINRKERMLQPHRINYKHNSMEYKDLQKVF